MLAEASAIVTSSQLHALACDMRLKPTQVPAVTHGTASLLLDVERMACTQHQTNCISSPVCGLLQVPTCLT